MVYTGSADHLKLCDLDERSKPYTIRLYPLRREITIMTSTLIVGKSYIRWTYKASRSDC